MNNLYDKIYEAIDNGIHEALIIDPVQDTSIRWHEKEKTSEFVQYDQKMVDMGLSVLWGAYNIGAYPGKDAKNWYGNYYAWGETEPKSEYSVDTYKGNIDELNSDNDVVTASYCTLRMPTKDECLELINNTTQEWVENYKDIAGLSGKLLTSTKNGNKIFIPAAGYYNSLKLATPGRYGYIWSSSLDNNKEAAAFYITVRSQNAYILSGSVYDGLSVRAVCEA